ncbi:family 20 glycosylhydrolase [Pollutibacter soli]|uniref:family 20 glycosylhydrolase n=1 Tax=Pollutibacter soli TaxID=3034157 RepID=UPI003013A70E
MKTSILILLVLFALACGNKKSFDASKLAIEWELIKNDFDDKGNFLSVLTFKNKSEVTMPSQGWKIYFSLRYHGTKLASGKDEVEIHHVNGELFTISPAANFPPVGPGQSFRLEFTGARKVANFQDVPSGFFWVNNDKPDLAIELTKPSVKRDTNGEKLITTRDGNNYAANATTKDMTDEELIKILPTPIKYTVGTGEFIISKETGLQYSEDFKNEHNYFIDEIEKVTGYKLDTTGKKINYICLRKKNGPSESYTLSVTSDTITITAADAAGAFYAIQSLKQLFPIDSWKTHNRSIAVRNVEIVDRPRFPVREFMLDVSRNFESKTNILRLLEVMSLYKMNTFHFHFNDDEGWRLEIPGLPELTEVGAVRGFPFESNKRLQPSYGSGPGEANHFGTGYYSRSDFIEILKYATQRHIEVIPEIESPGHARAAIRSMEVRYNRFMKDGKRAEAEQYLLHDLNDESKYTSAQYFNDNAMNVASPAVFAFIDKVLEELQKMYAEAGAPLTAVHMGGDEVAAGAWEKSPAIDVYKKNNPSIKTPKDLYADFFVKTTGLLKKRGLKITGWEEMIIEHPQAEGSDRKVIDNKVYRDDSLQFDAWWPVLGNQDMIYPIANSGYGVVLAPFDYFYFDLAQSPSFDEPGDAWIGYLGLQKTFSFDPFDIYNSSPIDFALKLINLESYKHKQRLTEAGRKNIRGIQGALWAENMTYEGYMEYQVLPRLLALAERAWAPEPSWTKVIGARRELAFNIDWSSFANRVGKRELPRLDHYNGGYIYRLPTPSFDIREETIFVNNELPGIIVRYSTDGTTPVATSPRVTGSIPKKGRVQLRAFSTSGRAGAVVVVNK